MGRLSELDNTIRNAIRVLGNPSSRRWQVFEKVNRKRTAPDIAKLLKMQTTNVVRELTLLYEKGLIESCDKRGKADVYIKILELRNTNLHSYIGTATREKIIEKPKTPAVETYKTELGVKSRAIDRIIAIGKKFEIENIDQNWVDALVILNFVETVVTKFLMDHGYTEQQIKNDKMHWEDKINKLEAKLYEEASKKGARPRTSVLTVLKNYRTQRNDVDHDAHVAAAKIKKHEVDLLLKTLDVFVKQVLEEHKKYCLVVASGS